MRGLKHNPAAQQAFYVYRHLMRFVTTMTAASHVSLLSLAPLIFLAGLPLGIAVQSIALLACGLIWLTAAFKNHDARPAVNRQQKIAGLAYLALLALWCGSTALNPSNSSQKFVGHCFGFAPLLLAPCLGLALRSEGTRRRVQKWFAIIAGLWFFVVLSQYVWGWKIQGSSVVTGSHYLRSQGFYSHPLTLAYVALMLFPLLWNLFLNQPKNWQKILGLISCLFIIYATASRTVQALAVLVIVWSIVFQAKAKTRWVQLAIVVVLSLIVASTDNLISQRFTEAFDTQSKNHSSELPDDRIAFWRAHLEMVKERPLLGHGFSLDKAYRLPYYEKIGLAEFPKKYEAHNQFLQLAAEAGLIGVLVAVFALWQLYRSWTFNTSLERRILNQSLVVFILGGLTQNAFFDGEVRYTLIGLMALAFALTAEKQVRIGAKTVQSS